MEQQIFPSDLFRKEHPVPVVHIGRGDHGHSFEPTQVLGAEQACVRGDMYSGKKGILSQILDSLNEVAIIRGRLRKSGIGNEKLLIDLYDSRVFATSLVIISPGFKYRLF